MVIERLPNLTYKIELDDGRIVRAFMSGRMKMNRISVLVGDKVEFEVDEYGANNRLTKRL